MSLLPTLAAWLLIGIGLLLAGGTLLGLWQHPHWFVRGWDFPRVQIAALLAVTALAYVGFNPLDHVLEWGFVALLLVSLGWQLYKIRPYTMLADQQVERAEQPQADASLSLLMSNVQMENEAYERWLNVVRAADPDVVLAVEVDAAWDEHIEQLAEVYPYRIRRPQDNYYGMVLLSRMPLHHAEVRYLVQDDIPSIRTEIELPCGRRIRFYGVHPRPPEPLRNQGATPRDAELVLLGREIEQDGHVPTIVAGDFNDVGWSYTTQLFCELSGLLDPRVGRGFYNSFDANHALFRFPLDHVFHSNDFKLVTLRLLDHVGSDHFPVFTTLYLDPDAPREQPEPEANRDERADAEERIDRATDSDETELDEPKTTG